VKLTILQENLAKGLAIASRSIAIRAQLPVLSNVLLATDKGRLKLSATNLETGTNLWLGAKVEKEGAITIPAKILTEYISSLPAEKIQLKAEEADLKVVCGSNQADFVGMNAGEFPNIPSAKGKPEVTFQINALIQAVEQVAFAAAQDEGRPVLTGVLLQTGRGKRS
jgi:DNA polymerase-3 subunit beta